MNRLKTVERIQREIVAVTGVVCVGGEALLAALPSGPVKTFLQVTLPLVATWRTRAKTVPIATFEALLARVEKKHKRK